MRTDLESCNAAVEARFMAGSDFTMMNTPTAFGIHGDDSRYVFHKDEWNTHISFAMGVKTKYFWDWDFGFLPDQRDGVNFTLQMMGERLRRRVEWKACDPLNVVVEAQELY